MTDYTSTHTGQQIDVATAMVLGGQPGAITPTSVAATGAVTGSNLSGTNTGDQVDIPGNAGTVGTINGLLAAGANVTLSGAGTAASPYTLAATASPSGSAAIPGLVVSLVGDSLLALSNNVSTDGLNVSTVNCGPITMARILSGGRIQSPLANNHAVGGTTWEAIDASVALAIADGPDFILMDGGTNDAAQGLDLQTSINHAFSAVRQVLAAGIIAIVIPIPPRTYGFTAAVGRWIESFNRTMQELAYGRADLAAAAGLPAGAYPLLLDDAPLWDYLGSGGAANPGFIGNDGLHGQFGFGLHYGAQIAGLVSKVRPASPTYCTNPYDIYDAANLKSGNLLIEYDGSNDGMMQGTNGIGLVQHGVTPSGSVPDGWQAACSYAASTGTTMAFSPDGPRSDGLLSGVRTRIRIAQGGGGGGFETFNLNYIGGGAAIASHIAAGDVVYFECRVWVRSATQLSGIHAQLFESGPATPQTFADGLPSANANAGLDSDDFPALLVPMQLRTPPMTLQAGINRVYPQIIITMYCANYSLDCYIGDCAVRKVT